ncbi:MAG: hypothetical protein JWQ90_5580 [Hydrocarboniphaga sp.]|uniref:hypothetical protein n=1 Tax=Hydrocarboniphaga sp. TaxID=2033016 RepID=UPI002602C1C6|nr:hypothetical protein [Hydrocarboniphaga sp.]MDB5973130.1 hypothetical protein [Hydrocarboniphaga sp.]
MLSFRGHKTLRLTLAALVLGLAPGTAAWADTETDAALQLDQNIQVLKDEALQFSRDAQLADEDFNYPPYSRVDVYVSVETAALLMHTISISIDDANTVHYDYSETDAKALLKSKGLQRIGRFNVIKGSHKLHAEYVGNYADAKPGETAFADRIDVVFDKSQTPVTLELIVGKANRGGKPILRLKEWRASK